MFIYFVVFCFRKQMSAGETIQSYNHQLVVTKSERQMGDNNNSSGHEDDNIDVVNDNDKDLGKYVVKLLFIL